MQYNFTVRKKDKGFQIIVSYKDGYKWKQKSKQGFATQREAKLYGQEIVDNLKKTITSPLDDSLKDITLIEFYKIYTDENKANVYATFKAYDNAFQKFNTLFNMKVKDISEIQIRKVINDLQQSIATKNMCITIITKVLAYAVSPYRIINNSPCKNIKRLHKTQTAKINAISEDDVTHLLASLKGHNYKYTILYSNLL